MCKIMRKIICKIGEVLLWEITDRLTANSLTLGQVRDVIHGR